MQRKMLFLIPLMLLICLALTAASAETRQEFEQGCWVKIGGTTTLYRMEEAAAPDAATPTDLGVTFVPVGSVSGGTYVRIGRTLDEYHMDYVTFWGDGGRNAGYVASSSVTSAVSTVRVDDGTSFDVPEALARDTSALIKYLNANGKGKTYVFDSEAGVIRVGKSTNNHNNNNKPSSGSSSNKKPKQTAAPETLEPCSFIYKGGEVEVTSLGLAYATIVKNGQQMMVPTQDLTWESSAKASQKLARVNAPKAGEAAMRDKSNKKGAIIEMIPTGTIVAVIKVGSSFARISHNGTVGFMSLSALKFSANKTPARIQNGSLVGVEKIVVRDAAKKNANVIGNYDNGTPVVIFDIGKTWAEIELDGLHGYTLSTNVAVGEIAQIEKAAAAFAQSEAEDEAQDGDDADYEPQYDDDADVPVRSVAEPQPTRAPVQIAPIGTETDDAYPFDSNIDGDAID